MSRDRLDGLARRIARLDPDTRTSLANDIDRRRGLNVEDGDSDTGPASTDPRDLASQLRYAIPPAEAERLVDRYGLDPTAIGVVGRTIHAAGPSVRAILQNPVRASGLIALTIALLVAGALGAASSPGSLTASEPAPDTSESGMDRTPTAIPAAAISITETRTRTDARTDRPGESPIRRPRHEDEAVEQYCPDPPVGIAPSALAPRSGPNATHLVLRSWHRQGNTTLAHFDATSAAIRDLPRTRWVGTYVSPGDKYYHVAIDRWSTPTAARRAYIGTDGVGHAIIVWGSYVVMVNGYDRDGKLLPGAMGTAEARVLVAAVTVPGTNRSLGPACAMTLMGNPP